MSLQLLELRELANAISTGWHSVRAKNQASKMLLETITRYRSRKRERYRKGEIIVYVSGANRVKAFTTDKIANIIEYGFKSYQWGLKVLNNAKNKVLGFAPNRYMRVLIQSKLTGKKEIRTVSERAIIENPKKWRMPAREGEFFLRRAVDQKKEEIKKIFIKAANRDIEIAVGKAFKKR